MNSLSPIKRMVMILDLDILCMMRSQMEVGSFFFILKPVPVLNAMSLVQLNAERKQVIYSKNVICYALVHDCFHCPL